MTKKVKFMQIACVPDSDFSWPSVLAIDTQGRIWCNRIGKMMSKWELYPSPDEPEIEKPMPEFG